MVVLGHQNEPVPNNSCSKFTLKAQKTRTAFIMIISLKTEGMEVYLIIL